MKKHTTKNPRGKKTQAGVVMTEALIVCLFFTMVFASIFHMTKTMGKKLEVNRTVRGCAWAYASGGCESLPSNCQNVSASGNYAPSTNGASQNAKVSNAARQSGQGVSQFIHKIMTGLKIVGETTTITQSGQVTRPAPIGGGTVKIGGFYSVLCNEQEQSVPDLIKKAYCGTVKIGC